MQELPEEKINVIIIWLFPNQGYADPSLLPLRNGHLNIKDGELVFDLSAAKDPPIRPRIFFLHKWQNLQERLELI